MEKGLQGFSERRYPGRLSILCHGDQIFVIFAKTFYNFSEIFTNHKYLVTLDRVVDIAFQKNREARPFARPTTC